MSNSISHSFCNFDELIVLIFLFCLKKGKCVVIKQYTTNCTSLANDDKQNKIKIIRGEI